MNEKLAVIRSATNKYLAARSLMIIGICAPEFNRVLKDLDLVWASLIAVALLSTAVAYLFYFEILTRAGSANLMLVTLLIPPIAVGLSVTILGEEMGNEALLGFGLIAVGLLVTDGRLLDKLRTKKHRFVREIQN